MYKEIKFYTRALKFFKNSQVQVSEKNYSNYIIGFYCNLLCKHISTRGFIKWN